MPKPERFEQAPTVEQDIRERDYELLKDYVNDIYEKSEAEEEVIESFKEHNETVLKYADNLAKKEEINPEEEEILKTATILHDVSKLGTEEGEEVPLVKHGWESAVMAEKKLEELGKSEEFIKGVKKAIERHMGPIPGFMEREAKKWEKETGEKIKFPRPEIITEKILYDADMLALIDPQGIEKIMNIRKNNEIFIKDDRETAAREGISQEEASLRSALKSGQEATASLFTDSAREKAKELLKESETQIRRKLEKEKKVSKVITEAERIAREEAEKIALEEAREEAEKIFEEEKKEVEIK